jgi:hypothetical protein
VPSTPVLTSGPFAGLPDLNQIYPNGPTGAPAGLTPPQSTIQIQGNQTGNVSQATALSTPTQPSVVGGALSTLGGFASGNPGTVASGVASTATGAATGTILPISGTGIGSITFGRVGAFLLGLVFIAGGIYLFGKPTIDKAVGTATKAATVV